ncbi:MAG: peroxiredoxin [Bdellovibrionales bacterium]|nr:peroxiredoxin [Bdellovibrionales bacterium]
MATRKKKATTKKAAKKKTTKKKAAKKAVKKATKKTTKKKAAKKATKKKATKKAAKKAVKKKATKKAAKKVVKKKVAKKKATKKKVTKKTAKKVTKKAAAKKVATTKPSSDLKTYDSQVAVGQPVPNFKAEMTGEKTFELSDHKGKTVVIYFYPKDSTPGCTVEGHDFTKLHSQFEGLGAEVYGVSRDSMKSHENFKSKQSYSIDLISDPDEKMCEIFGTIKLKNMYGKMVRGIERSTFVIGADGKLVKEWRKVKVPDHAAEVLAFVKSL